MGVWAEVLARSGFLRRASPVLVHPAASIGSRVTRQPSSFSWETALGAARLDAKSRRTRDLFTCTGCGHSTHADIGAAVNIKHRALAAQETEQAGTTSLKR
ncbi:zinc ribbon domain-containing protein [Streptomyces sp. NPDC021093]|uniref:zinc ribbon domain-containing protein n=1 Tax=Streptomyces sp. NPDC021093 TaxID=3365112 RepID=UPI003794CAAD